MNFVPTENDPVPWKPTGKREGKRKTLFSSLTDTEREVLKIHAVLDLDLISESELHTPISSLRRENRKLKIKRPLDRIVLHEEKEEREKKRRKCFFESKITT